MSTAYSPLPLGPPGGPHDAPSARPRRRGSALLLPAVLHSHGRALTVLALVALLFGSAALLHAPPSQVGAGAGAGAGPGPGAGPGAGLAAKLGDAARRPWTAAIEQSTRAREAAAAVLRGGKKDAGGRVGQGAGAARGDEVGDISLAAQDDALAIVVPETDGVDDEAGLSGSKGGKGHAEGKKRPRPFGKAAGGRGSGSAGSSSSPPADDLADDVDLQAGSLGGGALTDVDDVEAGTAHGTVEEADADLLADQPGLAALEDAAVRAPMAAIAQASHRETEDAAEASEGEGHAAAPPAEPAPARHEAAHAGTPEDDVGKGTAANAEDDALDANPAPGAPRPQIGTGGRLGSGAAAADLKRPHRVGAGAKAGAVVKEEAGRRVGTGARPGAKGMGTRRMRRRVKRR